MATRERMWKVAVAAVFCTNGLKDKELSKYTHSKQLLSVELKAGMFFSRLYQRQ